jgi:hypothetical protein
LRNAITEGNQKDDKHKEAYAKKYKKVLNKKNRKNEKNHHGGKQTGDKGKIRIR